uniref:Sex-determining region Y protein n=1 Tax=Eptatretus burgeri TaxID=7764 RepID=A0A8C4NCS9_EPTBU
MPPIYRHKDRIKRPMNAFMVWAQRHRKQMAQTMPRTSNIEVSKALGAAWHNITEQEKRPYYEESHRLEVEHQTMHPNWVYKPRKRRNKLSESTANPHNVAEVQGHHIGLEPSRCDSSAPSRDNHSFNHGDARQAFLAAQQLQFFPTCSTNNSSTEFAASMNQSVPQDGLSTSVPVSFHDMFENNEKSQSLWQQHPSQPVLLAVLGRPQPEQEIIPSQSQNLSVVLQPQCPQVNVVWAESTHIEINESPNVGYILPANKPPGQQNDIDNIVLHNDQHQPGSDICECMPCLLNEAVRQHENLSSMNNNVLHPSENTKHESTAAHNCPHEANHATNAESPYSAELSARSFLADTDWCGSSELLEEYLPADCQQLLDVPAMSLSLEFNHSVGLPVDCFSFPAEFNHSAELPDHLLSENTFTSELPECI